ncbi:MAG TPA: hypothetical protein DDW50_16035 [Firmicutes bacterium]|jgi:hypothetical protein|nr:hypothetical protein [Bacillota bacterium]
MLQWFRQKVSPQKARAFCDDDGVKVEYPDNSTASIRWEEIMKISVITTDQGPFIDDVFLALLGERKRCLVPSEANGYNEVFDRVSKLEGFDFERYIQAMASAENDEFTCWEQKNA